MRWNERNKGLPMHVIWKSMRRRVPVFVGALLVMIATISYRIYQFHGAATTFLVDDSTIYKQPLLVPLPEALQQPPKILSESAPSKHFNQKIQTSHATKENFEGPTFLMGIPSVIDEFERRQVVRETYLRYYKDMALPLSTTKDFNRICSLNDLQQRRVALKACQIAYFFFVGGNPQGPTELVEPNASFPIFVDGSKDTTEEDVVSLNIRENLEDGKTQTFFKYTSMILEEFPFDYIAKLDSDTLLFVPAFIRFAQKHIPKRPHNTLVYGGNPHDASACDPSEVNHPHACPLPLIGDLYMGGAFYWLSPDLASFISSPALPRDRLAIRHEDVDVGNFVFSHPSAESRLQVVNVTGQHLLIHRTVDGNWMFRNKGNTFRGILWAHSLNDSEYPGPYFKDHRYFRKVWRQFQSFWSSNETLSTKDIFQLYDLPGTKGDNFVHPNDYIYSKQDFDSSPVVVEAYKLIFFPVTYVGDATWRMLFRRMMGFSDWKDETRQFDGLRYLSNYSIADASSMMSSSSYTRAIFVRDPRLRLLASYMEHGVGENKNVKFHEMCCKALKKCHVKDNPDFPIGAFLGILPDCDEPYWRPQSAQMEPRFHKQLNFVGHYASIVQDAEVLLRKLGAWESYGQSGWGPDGQDRIFTDASFVSREDVQRYFTPETMKFSQKFYKKDFAEKAIFNFTHKIQHETP